jgi:hypothetical protein
VWVAWHSFLVDGDPEATGAVNVRTGAFVYFDNQTTRIGP